MLGSVAGYAKHHYYLGTPQDRTTSQKTGELYGKSKKRWVKTIRPKKKKFPMIICEPK